MSAVLAREAGGTINVLKLAKLLYLADRESMRRYAMPISFDELASMPHGPVLSTTLDLSRGRKFGQLRRDWAEWMLKRSGDDLGLARKFDRADLDQLSDADIEILEDVWKSFGRMDQFQLRDYTHKHCKEWQDPGRTSLPIDDADVFVALGRSKAEAKEMAAEIAAERAIDKVFARLS